MTINQRILRIRQDKIIRDEMKEGAEACSWKVS